MASVSSVQAASIRFNEATSKASKPSRSMLDRYSELKAQQKELRAELSLLEKESEALSQSLQAYTEEKGGSVLCCDYALRIEDGDVRPKWKEEYIAALGPSAALSVVQRTPASKKLTVLRIK